MLEDGNLFFFADFVEVVHVELADEGGEFFVFEVLREDLIFEELFVFDYEAAAVVSPLDDVTVALILKDLVGLHDKVGDLLFPMDPLLAGVLPRPL